MTMTLLNWIMMKKIRTKKKTVTYRGSFVKLREDHYGPKAFRKSYWPLEHHTQGIISQTHTQPSNEFHFHLRRRFSQRIDSVLYFRTFLE